tara:strand:- start:3681 stop:4241 length:561 start_codon:yes stop_codon:yes gene_type:complete
MLTSYLVAQPTICGYAVNTDDSTAIERATIFLHDKHNLALPTDIRTQTDKNGYYEIPVDTGSYSVNAWTYVDFRSDSFAFVVQPGVFKIDNSHFAFKVPCFYINFFYSLNLNDEEYEEGIVAQKNNFMFMRSQQKSNNDSLALEEPDWSQVEWPEMVLPYMLGIRIETIDTLFTHYPSRYIRKKDW